jgi:hypothetical protein
VRADHTAAPNISNLYFILNGSNNHAGFKRRFNSYGEIELQRLVVSTVHK